MSHSNPARHSSLWNCPSHGNREDLSLVCSSRSQTRSPSSWCPWCLACGLLKFSEAAFLPWRPLPIPSYQKVVQGTAWDGTTFEVLAPSRGPQTLPWSHRFQLYSVPCPEAALVFLPRHTCDSLVVEGQRDGTGRCELTHLCASGHRRCSANSGCCHLVGLAVLLRP